MAPSKDRKTKETSGLEIGEAHELCFAHLLWRCPLLEQLGVVLSASCVEPLAPLIEQRSGESALGGDGRDFQGTTATTEEAIADGDMIVLQSAVTVLLHGDNVLRHDGAAEEEEVKGESAEHGSVSAGRTLHLPFRIHPQTKNRSPTSWSACLARYPYFSLPFPVMESVLSKASLHPSPRAALHSSSPSALRYFDIIVAMDRPTFEFALHYYQGCWGVESDRLAASSAEAASVGKRGASCPWARCTSATSHPGGPSVEASPAHLSEGQHRQPVLLVYPSTSGHRHDDSAGAASGVEASRGRTAIGVKRPRSGADDSTYDSTMTPSLLSPLWDAQSERDLSLCGYAVQQLLEMLFEDPSAAKTTHHDASRLPATTSRSDGDGSNVTIESSNNNNNNHNDGSEHHEGIVNKSQVEASSSSPSPTAFFNKRWRERVEVCVDFIGPLLGVEFMIAMV